MAVPLLPALVRRSGLGAAYVRGITHVIDQLGADFSHDPTDAGRLAHAGGQTRSGVKRTVEPSIVRSIASGRTMN